MLPGLTWFTPLDTKSFCPHTRFADLEPDGKPSTRLFPASTTNIFPLESVLTSEGPATVFGEENGAELVFAVIVLKSDWPTTPLADEPKVALGGNTSTRLAPKSASD